MGKGRGGLEVKGGEVATRQGTRVDGDFPPGARHRPFMYVRGFFYLFIRGVGSRSNCMLCNYKMEFLCAG